VPRSGAAPQRATSGPAAGRRRRSPAETTVIVAWAWTALLVGGAVSLLHLLHNRVEGVRDAVLWWVFFAQVWGLAGAAAAAGGLAARRLLRRNRNRANPAASDSTAALAADLTWALGLFHVVFFLPVALWGRTYDDVAWAGPPRTAAGMILLLAAAAVVVVATALLASRFLARRLAAASTAGALPRLGARFALGSLALHLLVAVAFRLAPAAPEPRPSSFRPLRAEERAASRVVLVGLDGADWRVLRPLVERGELPTSAG
jgi:hypothetical protein